MSSYFGQVLAADKNNYTQQRAPETGYRRANSIYTRNIFYRNVYFVAGRIFEAIADWLINTELALMYTTIFMFICQLFVKICG